MKELINDEVYNSIWVDLDKDKLSNFIDDLLWSSEDNVKIIANFLNDTQNVKEFEEEEIKEYVNEIFNIDNEVYNID